MGVPDLWDIVKPAIRPRVPLSVFASDFHQDNGRPLRVAIDSYIWLFETGHIPNSDQQPNAYKIVQGFLSRIWLLISYNISFVIVFDGVLKPSFKRNFEGEGDDSKFANFQQLYNQMSYVSTADNLLEVILLKKVLNLLNVAYVEAAGEAESECSRLQDLGVVDYVISNDSDSMLFGAKRIFRNFSKFYEDCEQDEYYVDPVELEGFFHSNRIDRFRLIFFALLRGADYNAGVNKVGTERARRIAFVGTKLNKADDGCIDFHDQFLSIFYQNNTHTSLPNLDKVSSLYEFFFKTVEEEVSSDPVAYFGRNDPLRLGYLPLYYIAILYFYPILNQSIFKFLPGTMNCLVREVEEVLSITSDTIPQLRSFQVVQNGDIQFSRHGGGVNGTVGYSKFEMGVNKLSHDKSLSHSSDKLKRLQIGRLINTLHEKLPNVTSAENYIINNCVKSLLIYFLSISTHDSISNKHGVYVKASKLKVLPSRGDIGRRAKEDYESGDEEIPKWVNKMYMFKYRPDSLLKEFLGTGYMVTDADKDLESNAWVSEKMINNLMLKEFIDEFEKTTGTQKNTLQSFGLILGSPTKSLQRSPRKTSGMLLRRNNANVRSPSKKAAKSPRKQTKRSPQKQIELGQSTITNFFKLGGKQQLQLETIVADGDNVIELSSEDEIHEILPVIHDVMKTPSKIVPTQDIHKQMSPIKKDYGVKKLNMEGNE